jgi:hypothetical protein
MAEERSSMMAAIDQLRPNLLPLAEAQPEASTRIESEPAETISCWKCGSVLVADEQFCGKCGAPRSETEMPGLPGKLAPFSNEDESILSISAEQMHPNTAPLAGVGARLSSATHEMNLSSSSAPVSAERTETAARAQRADEEAIQTALSIASQHPDLDLENASAILAKAKTPDGNWSSAAKARNFLENLGDTPPKNAVAGLWRAHRGDFYLAIAVILVVAVVRWGMMTSDPANATGNPASSSVAPRKTPADANLSAFDKLLISLGLAEAPDEPTEDKGNPETQVWIDQRTALYYCPGSDLYGKTEKGRFATQRDAQLDQFEPALRKACD